MGSVSMQSQASSRGERLSAFVDGELFGEEHLNLDKFISELDGADRTAWSSYHLIGDALRSDDLAVSPAASSAFLNGFAARLEASRTCWRLPRCRQRPGGMCWPFLCIASSRRTGVCRCRCCRHAHVDRRAAAARRAGGPGTAQMASVQHGDSLQRVAMASMPAARSADRARRTSFATQASTSIWKLTSNSHNNRSCPAQCR